MILGMEYVLHIIGWSTEKITGVSPLEYVFDLTVTFQKYYPRVRF